MDQEWLSISIAFSYILQGRSLGYVLTFMFLLDRHTGHLLIDQFFQGGA